MVLLHLTKSRVGAFDVVAAVGEVDVASSPSLQRAIEECVGEGCRAVVDLGSVSFLDSTGLAVLVQAYNACRDAGGGLRLVVTDPNVKKVFEVTALDDVFAIYPSLADATTP